MQETGMGRRQWAPGGEPRHKASLDLRVCGAVGAQTDWAPAVQHPPPPCPQGDREGWCLPDWDRSPSIMRESRRHVRPQITAPYTRIRYLGSAGSLRLRTLRRKHQKSVGEGGWPRFVRTQCAPDKCNAVGVLTYHCACAMVVGTRDGEGGASPATRQGPGIGTFRVKGPARVPCPGHVPGSGVPGLIWDT